MWDGNAEAPIQGNGSTESPYLIGSAEELAWFSEQVNSGSVDICAELTDDIVLNDTTDWQNWGTNAPANTWTPIGNDVKRYAGSFDGKGRRVSGIYINTGNYLGLFGYIKGGSVQNVGVVQSYIRGGSNVGAVCGMNNTGTITSCYNHGTIESLGGFVGGICGQNLGTVIGCYNYGSVWGAQLGVGGVCGITVAGGSVSGCGNGGSVTSTANYAGGVCGSLSAATEPRAKILNSFNIGIVQGPMSGGICGFNLQGTITGCYYLNTSSAKGVGNNQGSVQATVKSAAAFASGEVAYFLGSLFGQTLGADDIPVARASDDSNAVFKLTYMNGEAVHAAQYYNSGNSVSAAGIPQPLSESGYFREWNDLPDRMPGRDVTATAIFGDPTPPEITTGSLPDAAVGAAYSAQITAGGTQPIIFSVSPGSSLPQWLSLNEDTGVLSGTPTMEGTFTFTIQAANPSAMVNTQALSITVKTAPSLTAAPLPSGMVSVPYSAQITAGGTQPITFSVSPGSSLPQWLSLNEDTGVLFGTPIAEGTFTFTIRVTNIAGSNEKPLSINVSAEMSGDGMQNNPYQIRTAQQLQKFAQIVNDSNASRSFYAILMNNIALNDVSDLADWETDPPANTWTPIGYNITKRFTGGFNGNGHTISGIYINASADYQGLFGYIGANTTIQNLRLTESYIKGKSYVGGICGFSLISKIENCYASATVIGSDSYAGGICGYNNANSVIQGCHNTGTITGPGVTGGISGHNGGMIRSCRNAGTINSNGTGNQFGGVCGRNYDGSIIDSYNIGEIYTPDNNNVGGVCGYSPATVTNAYNTGTVTGKSNAGMVCGFVPATGTVTSCYFLGSTGGIGNNMGTGTATGKSADAFASGEVAYLLGSSFGQTLGTDTTPVFCASNGSNAVYRLTYMNGSTEYAVQYYNSGNAVSPADIVPPTGESGIFSEWGGLPAAMPAQDVTVNAVFTAYTYTIEPIPDQTLTALTTGYATGTQESRTLTITRTGTGDLNNLTAALSEDVTGSFTVSGLAATSLNNSMPSTTFDIAAIDGLTAGNYTATVTIGADHMTDVTFTVTQLVNAAPPVNNPPTAKTPVPARNVEVNGTAGFSASDIAEDANSDPLAITAIVSGPDSGIATANLNSGTVTITGVGAGSTSVEVTVSDGTDTVDVTVPIEVTAVPAPVTLLTAVADGAMDVVTSTRILLTFDMAIEGLSADDIAITNGTGSVAKGALTGSGTTWSIALTSITTQGDVTVAISAPPGYAISGSPKTVAVYKAAPVVSATVFPVSGGFDIHTPDDVETTITWNSATAVAAVKNGSTSLASPADYEVTGNGATATLTIKKAYLETKSIGSLVLTISFDKGDPAALAITVTDTTPPSIEPEYAHYDLSATRDVTTTVTWNSAQSVTDVVYGTSSLIYGTEYSVDTDILTIRDNYLSGLAPSKNDTLVFEIQFDTSYSVNLTVNVVDNYTPSNDATLNDLKVGGTTVTGFASSVTEYAVELPYSTLPGSTAATVSATASEDHASIIYTQASTLPGDAVVTVTAEDGTTTKTYTIHFTLGAAPPTFVAVTNITGVPATATAGTPLTLTGTVAPVNATNQTIVWSIQNVGTTGAMISGNTLSTTAAGTVTVRATIMNGETETSNYTQDFEIEVSAASTYKTLISVTAPTAITGVANGTEKTASALGLPFTVTLVTNGGNVSASVSWDVASSSYNVSSSSAQTFTVNGTVTLPAGVINPGNVSLSTSISVTVNARSNGGGNNGDDGSIPKTPSTPSTQNYVADVKADNGTDTALLVTVNKNNGSAAVTTGFRQLTSGRTVITIPSIPDVDTYSVGIPVPELSTTNVQGTLTLNTDKGSVTVTSNMLAGVSGISGSKAEISIGQGDKSALPEDVRAAIGDKPLIQLMLSIDGKQTNWSNPDVPVTVSIPYTPTAEELANPEGIVIWYIDGSGNVVTIPNGHYDSATGVVTFDTTHFSGYAVAYNKVSFNDVASGAWYNEAVGFIAAREITTGTGSGNFSPDVKLTRGQFILMLMKAYGIAPDTNPADNFSDADNTYYTGYLAAAKRLEISAGVGNNMFAPEMEITHQEMFTLLYNALKVIGQLPQGDTGKTLSDFTDAGQIDSWAKDAMTLLVKTGTVGGNNGALSPLSTTTRAEMAQVLYNLLGK
ncbi:MAG: X2-like carbohydrate binding domain-containing protein [Clostridiaceae bacterium]|nr:X2-like carbohydrate binding domain-containing protein [Clostridiaceae bacterium]